jgi:hypothetical protein
MLILLCIIVTLVCCYLQKRAPLHKFTVHAFMSVVRRCISHMQGSSPPAASTPMLLLLTRASSRVAPLLLTRVL